MTSTNESDQPQELLRVDGRGRVQTSREQREAILDEFARSGVSGAAFARLHGIKYATFANWVQKRRRQRQGVAGSVQPPAMELTEVVLSEQPVGAGALKSSLRIELPGKAIVAVSDRRQVQLAAELLRALRSC